MFLTLELPTHSLNDFKQIFNDEPTGHKEEEIIQKYNELYRRKSLSPYQIPGKSASCNGLGLSSAADRLEAINRISFYRYLADFPDHMVKNDDIYDKSQSEAAKIMKLEDILTNKLLPSYQCYTTEAEQAASKSVLAKGYVSLASSITKYIHEGNSNTINSNCEHRRQLLYPQLENSSFGIYDDYSNVRVSGISKNDNHPNLNKVFYAYPPPGYFPRSMIPNYFSFSKPKNELINVENIDAKITVASTSGGTFELNPGNKMLYTDEFGDSTYIMFFADSVLSMSFSSAKSILVNITMDNATQEYFIYPFDYPFSHCLYTNSYSFKCPEYSENIDVTGKTSSEIADVISDIINSTDNKEIIEITLVSSDTKFSIYKSDLLSKDLFIKGITLIKDKRKYIQPLIVIDDSSNVESSHTLTLSEVSLETKSKIKLSKLYLDEESAKSLYGSLEVDQIAYASSGKDKILIHHDNVMIDNIVFWTIKSENGISFNTIKIEALATKIEVFSDLYDEMSIPSIHIQSTANTNRFVVERSGYWSLIKNKDLLTSTLFSDDIKNGGSSGIMPAPAPGTGEFVDLPEPVVTTPVVPRGGPGVIILVVCIIVVIIIIIVVVVVCMKKKKKQTLKDGSIQL